MHLMRPLDLSCYAGASAFLSTPADLVRFGMAVNAGKLLRPDTVQLLQRSQRASGGETGYGLGWEVETVTVAGQQTRTAGHNGESRDGMTASLLTLPDHGIVVSVVSNISHANTDMLANRIAQVFAEQAKAQISDAGRGCNLLPNQFAHHPPPRHSGNTDRQSNHHPGSWLRNSAIQHLHLAKERPLVPVNQADRQLIPA